MLIHLRKSSRIVLTHGDYHQSIIVKDGIVSGIMDCILSTGNLYVWKSLP